ncbi:MAG: succinylglutamate desuccinylase/aspartoacylase family protein [Anaerolineae bacterium]|nr:succinylglutamate desuccinylase/aspartoacylase family protein [Anaerolineae bacterium]
MPITVYDHNQIDFDRPGKTIYEVGFHFDGTWGYAQVPMAVINGHGPRNKSIVCFGGTHGNEYEGQVSVWRLMHELDPADISGRVILIPRLNQPACNTGTRDSQVDGVNLNRAFPGAPRGSLTYRIADFVTTRIFPQVEVVLDIHAAGSGARFALCSSFHMVPDPQQFEEMVTVASLFDTPFVFIYSSEMASGLLTDQAEALGKITIGGEFGFAQGVDRVGTRHAYEGIKNVLRHYRVLPGDIVKIDPNRPTPPKLVSAIHLNEYIPAPYTGVFEPWVDTGDWVEAGQGLGVLYDFELVDQPGQVVYAPRSGYMLLVPFQVPTRKGVTMLVIAQEVQR